MTTAKKAPQATRVGRNSGSSVSPKARKLSLYIDSEMTKHAQKLSCSV